MAITMATDLGACLTGRCTQFFCKGVPYTSVVALGPDVTASPHLSIPAPLTLHPPFYFTVRTQRPHMKCMASHCRLLLTVALGVVL